MSTQPQAGSLYIVATPIGNLEDISSRAVSVLSGVDLVAAEDTRHTARLLAALGIRAELLSFHDYNESQRSELLMERLKAGSSIALVSDAGTPLISDPGYILVKACRDRGFPVIPVPGPSALITALSVSGLPSDRFLFEGFLPRNKAKRRARLAELKNVQYTLICYESSHRIRDALDDMKTIWGGDRRVVVARELTKQYETVLSGSLSEISQEVEEDQNQQRGEFVVLVAGNTGEEGREVFEIRIDQLLEALLPEMAPSKCAAIIARLSGLPKKQLYERALALKADPGH